MIILGIDCGIAITGWGVVEKGRVGNKTTFIEYGAILTSKDLSIPERLLILDKELTKIIKKYSPDESAVEELFYFKNQKTVIQVAEARGVILSCLERQKIHIAEYTPLQVKQGVTSSGRADKAQVQKMVKLLLNLKEIPKPDDAADALAIALTHSFVVR